MEPAVNRKLSLEEYNQLEIENQARYEFHDGEIYAMAGGEPNHSIIAVNVSRVIGNGLLTRPCTTLNSDAKVHISSINKSFYPDVWVVCGKLERSDKDTRALTNPILIVEVISDTSAAYDRGQKFMDYSRIPTLKEYVLIEQKPFAAQVFFRSNSTDLWQMQWFSEKEEEVIFRSLDITIPLKDFYDKVE